MFTALVVEDETLVRVSIIQTLSEADIPVTVVGEASSGEEALRILKEVTPDFVITDVRMPGMSGIELIREIRSRGIKVNVIVISGYADFEYVRQALRYEAQDYLLKPVKLSELNEVLARHGSNGKRPDNNRAECSEEEIMDYLRENYNRDISLETAARYFNFSPKYFTNLIKQKLGESFTNILIQLRMDKAKELLIKTNFSVKEIAMHVGYTDQQYFRRLFKKKNNYRPTEFRKKYIGNRLDKS